jgi:hypothetical protein
MSLNFLGPAAAASAFFSVWLGHVAVRKIEYISPVLWLPALSAALLGIGFEAGALLSRSTALSAVLGILGMTLLWDAVEFFRQQRRVQKGHAPANPHNPRHAALLLVQDAAVTNTTSVENPLPYP